MLGNGAQSQRREEGQRGKDIHHEHKNHCKARRAGLQCAGRLVDIVFLHQGAGDGQLNHNGQIPPQEHDDAGGHVPEVGVVRQPFKTGAVVRRRGGVFIQHLAQAVETGIGNAGLPGGCRHRQGSKGQDQQGMDDDGQCRQLHFASLDLLAQIFGGAAHHQPADEHRQDGVQNHVHEAHALAAKDTVEHHVQHRHHSAQRRQGVVHVVDGACGEGCCYGGKQSGLGDAEADFLALHAACGLVEADLRQSRVALQLSPVAKAQANQEQNSHGQKDAAAFFAQQPGRDAFRMGGQHIFPGRVLLILETSVTHHLAEGNDTGAGQQHHGIQFNQVGQDGGVLHGGGGVGAEEAAAVGAQVLDDFKRRHRPHPQNLIRAFQGLHHDILREILRHTLPYQQQPAHQGEGQQHAGGDANQIGKEVAYMIFCLAGQAADERDTGGIAAGCGNKHHKDDDQHLGEVAQAAFAGVVLQVGVGHKTNDGIKGQVRLHALNPVGIQKGNALDAENHIANSHHHRVGAQQGQGVLFPVHALLRVHAAQLVNDPVDPIHNGVGKGVFSCGDMIKIPPHWNNKDQINDACQDQLYHTKNLLYSVLDLKTDPDAPGRIPDIRPAAKQ